MGGLTLPTLHSAIPAVIQSEDAQRLALDVLRERSAAGLPVSGLRASSAADALRATIASCTGVRGPLADDTFEVLVALEPEGYYGDGSDFTSSGSSLAVYPCDEQPTYRYIGRAIEVLEASSPGLGETVLAAIGQAESALPGVVCASGLESFLSMMRWGDLDSSATDEKALHVLVAQHGYTVDSLPILPSQFVEVVGGPMWLKPKSRLSAPALRSALEPFGSGLAAELTGIVKRHLPAVCRRVRGLRTYNFHHGYYCTQLVILRSNAGEDEFEALFDDICNDRQNGSEDCALFRCTPLDHEPLATAGRTGRTRPASKRAPPFDGVAAVADVMRGYHLLNRLLHLLERVEQQPS